MFSMFEGECGERRFILIQHQLLLHKSFPRACDAQLPSTSPDSFVVSGLTDQEFWQVANSLK